MRPLLARFLLLLSLAVPATAPAGTSSGGQCAPDAPAPLGALSETLRALPDAARSAPEGARVRSAPQRLATVPADVQRDTLAKILSRVRQRTNERQIDPTLPKAVVVLDVDYTAVMHIRRSEEAIRRVAERYAIEALANPAELPLLPTYEDAGFQRWVDEMGLREAYPEVDWEEFADDVSGASWSSDLRRTEVVTPGLVELIRRVKYTGGKVVFLTGRRSSERDDVLAVLEAGGVKNPNLITKSSSKKTPVWKAERVPEIEAAYGEIVAVIDDMKDNRDAIVGALPPERDVMSVPIAVPGFTTDITPEELEASEWRVSTLERNRVDPVVDPEG